MSNEDLLLREQYYIDLYETMMPNGYNMRPSDRTKGFNHSEYSKQLISSIKLGKTLSDETKAKISSSLKGRIFTDAQRLKISEAGAARGARRSGITAGSSGPRREALKNRVPLAANLSLPGL